MEFSREIKEFISSEKWTFARTYEKSWPHEWIIKERCNAQLFEEACFHIQEYGYDGPFYRITQRYFREGGQVYWAYVGEGVLVNSKAIINRVPIELCYESRKENHLMPESVKWAKELDGLRETPGWGKISLQESVRYRSGYSPVTKIAAVQMVLEF